MNIFTCASPFTLSASFTVSCSGGVYLSQLHTLSSGDYVFTCSAFNNLDTYLKCPLGFSSQAITDTTGDIFTMFASSSVVTLNNSITANTYEQVTVKQENMVVLQNLGVYEISLVTGATVSILLLAFVFRLLRKMIWY